MKQFLPQSIQNLSHELAKLPGIGPKTAHRLTFYLINRSDDDLAALGRAFIELKSKLARCAVCYTISETDPCPICADAARDGSRVLVVEEPLDMLAMEKTGWDGRYHVLGGVISPINGVGPDDLTVDALLRRLASGEIGEVVLATDPSLEGEATASYITQIIAANPGQYPNLKVSRIARGLPVGGDLEYADEMTLRRALEGRQDYRIKK